MPFKENYIGLRKNKSKKFFTRSGFKEALKFSNNFKSLHIVIPSNWSLTILNDSNYEFYVFYLLSKRYYFKFSAFSSKSFIYFCYNTNTLTIVNLKLATYCTVWNKELNFLLYMFTSFFFIKLKFKGKGYYIYKNYRNTIAPQFGYYHRIYIYSFFNTVKFLSKTKLLIFGLTKKDVLLTAYTLKSKRTINIFTGRGVRFARQLIYKKTGKVSSYR